MRSTVQRHGPRGVAAALLGAVIAVSVVWLVIDSARPATAAGKCQYQYAPYGKPCPYGAGGTPFAANLYVDCVDDHAIVVPDGRRLVLQMDWLATTERQVKRFLSASSTSAVVGGLSVASAKKHWGKPTADGSLWVARWEYDTGRVVTSSTQPFTVEFEVDATKEITDGTSTWAAGVVVVAIGGPCLVSGLSP